MIACGPSADRTTHGVCAVLRPGPMGMQLLRAKGEGGSAVGWLALAIKRKVPAQH